MATEDFTTFTATDTDGVLTVNATSVTAAAVDRTGGHQLLGV